MELIRTKLSPPVNPSGLVDRPRLAVLLERAAGARITLVQAAAGYGKTSLLSQWFRQLATRESAAGWLTLDSAEREAADLLAYVAAAVAGAVPDSGQVLEEIQEHGREMAAESMIAVIVNQLQRAETPVFLFFDDLHRLGERPLTALARLLELAPDNAHFLFATRETPDLPLGRYRALGQLLEIEGPELRFTAGEIRLFLAEEGTGNLSVEDVEALDQRTEGWIAGIKLATMAPGRGISTRGESLSLTGSERPVSEFFAEEVFSAQREAIQGFLLRTSVLGRFTPDLCNAVTGGDNARTLLDEIESSGLFLLQLDRERTWYRYHHLFGEFLQRLLDDRHPGLRPELLARACEWCENQGLYVEAIEYALLAEDPCRAAGILDSCCQDLTYAGHIFLVASFARRLPPDILERFPAVMLDWAWLLTRNLRFEEVRRILSTVRTRLDTLNGEGALSREEADRLGYLLHHREMMLAAARDQPREVEAQCRALIDGYREDSHPYLAGTNYAQLLYAQREQFRMENLESLAARARGILSRSGYLFGLISVQSVIGLSLFQAGKVDAAIAALQEGIEEARRFSGGSPDLAALPGMPLSAIHYARNELESAGQLQDTLLDAVTVHGFVDQLLVGYVTRARLDLLRHGVETAFRVLDRGLAIARDRELERLRLGLVAERVRLLLIGDRGAEAADYLSAEGVPPLEDGLDPGPDATSVDEIRAVARLRIELYSGNAGGAVALARQWRNFCGRRHALLAEIRWGVLLAQGQLLTGENRAAQRSLREALALAAPLGVVRYFLDEGAPIHTLVANIVRSAPASDHPTDRFAARVLAAFDGGEITAGDVPAAASPDTDGLLGSITPRELEILSLIGNNGLSNREVAVTLGLTEGSVKWYMQQVFDKLGTRRRAQAVVRARQMGLIK